MESTLTEYRYRHHVGQTDTWMKAYANRGWGDCANHDSIGEPFIVMRARLMQMLSDEADRIVVSCESGR